MNNFIKDFILSSVLLFSLLFGLILSVDPYEKYGFNLFGFKTKAVMFGREIKFLMLDNTKIDYKAFLLGSSSAHRYETENIKKLTGYATYNYSVQHANVEDYLAQTRHILSKFSPSLIMIQMDFYTLNKNFKVDPRLYNSQLNKFLKQSKNAYFTKNTSVNTYLTLDAIRDTFRVIGVNLFSKPKHSYLLHGNYPKEKELSGPLALSQNNYGVYEISKKRILMLEKIKSLCDEKGVEIITFTAPKSIKHFQGIHEQKLENQLKIFKQTLASIFIENYDFFNESSMYYSTTKYMRDSAHPNKELSKEVMARIFGKSSLFNHPDFGKLISK